MLTLILFASNLFATHQLPTLRMPPVRPPGNVKECELTPSCVLKHVPL